MGRSKLTADARRRIAEERQKGASLNALAARHGVARSTIIRAIRTVEGQAEAVGARARHIGLRVTPEELAAFDMALESHGIGSRSEGLRRLVIIAAGALGPDERTEAELAQLRIALVRAGTNVNQIARRLNEARRRGEPSPYGETHASELRALGRVVEEVARKYQALRTGETPARRQVDAALQAREVARER